jgi:RNA polymerase sigma-70 factor (ECF subfamily)
MTDQLSRGANVSGTPPKDHREGYFTNDASSITVEFVALETFYRRNKSDLVLWMAARSSIPFEQAEDVFQEAFARALGQAQGKQPIANPEAWFKKVMRQILADAHPKPDAHRKHRVLETLTDPAELPDRPEHHGSGILPAEWLEMKEEARLVVQEIGALPEKSRAVMAEYYSGVPCEEIARRLDMSVVAVRQNLARGRKTLRKRAESREKSTS